MTEKKDWRAILADSLGWEQAHASLENAIKGLPADLRGKRPDGYPHSVWELLEHIRIAQGDLLDFCVNPNYKKQLEWPKDYWPRTVAPASEKAWSDSVSAFRRDRDALARFTTETKQDLTGKIPHGTGQTYLRTILLAVDHSAYHIGQIVSVRRLLGVWPAS